MEQLIDSGDVIKAGIISALTFQGFWITDRTAFSESRTIRECHHAIDVDTAADGRPVEGLKQRIWQSQTTGLHNDAVELISPFQQTLDGGQEVVLHRAAEAAVVELHKTSFQLFLGTEAATANQVSIKTNTAEFVHHHGQPLTTVDQQMTQHRGFASPQESGDHRHR